METLNKHRRELVSFALLLYLLAVSSCAVNRKATAITAESVAANHSATISRSLDGTQTPNVTVSGSSNTVQIQSAPFKTKLEVSDDATMKGDASGTYRSQFHASVSTWIALGFFAVALAVLLVAYALWRRGTAAGAAADTGLAAVIDAAQHGVTGPALQAMLEKTRGKIRTPS